MNKEQFKTKKLKQNIALDKHTPHLNFKAQIFVQSWQKLRTISIRMNQKLIDYRSLINRMQIISFSVWNCASKSANRVLVRPGSRPRLRSNNSRNRAPAVVCKQSAAGGASVACHLPKATISFSIIHNYFPWNNSKQNSLSFNKTGAFFKLLASSWDANYSNSN